MRRDYSEALRILVDIFDAKLVERSICTVAGKHLFTNYDLSERDRLQRLLLSILCTNIGAAVLNCTTAALDLSIRVSMLCPSLGRLLIYCIAQSAARTIHTWRICLVLSVLSSASFSVLLQNGFAVTSMYLAPVSFSEL